MKIFISFLACVIAIAFARNYPLNDEPNDAPRKVFSQTTAPPRIPQERTEELCLMGYDLACEINCLTSIGHFHAYCDENNDCKCRPRMQPEGRSVAICVTGGSYACNRYCQHTVGKANGYCSEEKKCICKKNHQDRKSVVITSM